MFPPVSYDCIAALLHCAAVGSVAAAASQAFDAPAVLRSARRAQADFEWVRRLNLARGPSSSRSRCDIPIGRLCYWYAGRDEPAPDEPPRIREAREQLLAALNRAAALLPGDQWIAGQRVRYLLEAGRPTAALGAAQDCRAAPWWCEALGGLALHAAADFPAADSSFERALRDMPQAERCRWTDISVLLEGADRKEYERASCEARQLIAARWWWLATPLFSRRGNDRRTEHFARVTLACIEQDGANPFGLRWGDDLRELLIRYGAPTGWTAQRPAAALDDPVIVGYDRTPSFHFGPSPRGLGRPLADAAVARPEDWTVATPWARERYAPRYAARFVPLAHQVAVFRRGDSALVVACYEPAADTLFANRPVLAALVLARDGAPVATVRRDTTARGSDVLVAVALDGPLLMSLEVVAASEQRVARARYGLGYRDHGLRVSLSDVLLFDPPDPSEPRGALPASLTETLPLAYGTARVPMGRRLGLFWELYGLDPAGETVTTALALIAERGGWLRRAAQSVGLAPRRRAVELQWDEMPGQQGGVTSRALALDLTGVAPGRYRIELSVTAQGQGPVTATRELEVVPR